jgi:hypothetical protein
MDEVHPEAENLDVGEVPVYVEADCDAVRQGEERLPD